MKREIAFCLTIVLVLALVACSSSSQSGGEESEAPAVAPAPVTLITPETTVEEETLKEQPAEPEVVEEATAPKEESTQKKADVSEVSPVQMPSESPQMDQQTEPEEVPAVGAEKSTDEEQLEPVEAEVEKMIELRIDGTAIPTAWEDNESVTVLRELLANGALSVQMSMYGGFEQVGSLGTSLPRNDVQMTTNAGDIVLYSGNQIVVFYGSNSWAYTRLGKVESLSAQELRDLLGGNDVTITLSLK